MSRMRTLWLRMAEIYGHRWTSSFGDNPDQGAGVTWAKGLEQLTPTQLAHGLSAAITSTDGWPPTLPEFRAMCMDIPSIAVVRHRMAYPGETISPFMRQFWAYLNTVEYNSGDEYRCERAVKEAYELTSEHVMRSKPLPAEAAAAIGHSKREKPTPADPAVARRYLDEIGKQLGISDEPAGEETR
jgi:hypothetical protein